MPVKEFEDFLKLANFFYKTVGMKPYDKPGSTKQETYLNNLMFLVGIININLIQLGELYYVILAFKKGEHFVEATMAMSYLGFASVGELKLIYIWSKKNALNEFTHKLIKIFPKNAEEQKKYNLHAYLRFCNLITIGFSVLYMILIWTYNLLSIAKYLLIDRLLNIYTVEKMLPYVMYSPWDWHDNFSYYLLYASHCGAGYVAAAGQISADLLLCGLATQIIMHYDFIANTLDKYKTKIRNNDRNNEICRLQDMHFLSDIINFHSKILSLSNIMNDIFGVPLLINFISSSLVICFVGFQMTIGVDATTLFKLFLFLVSSTSQVYLLCYYGQLLIDASEKVAFAAYSLDWSTADINFQKMLILLAQRAQQPALLKATTFVHISRDTMTEIMQMSYKFFALIRTMYSE